MTRHEQAAARRARRYAVCQRYIHASQSLSEARLAAGADGHLFGWGLWFDALGDMIDRRDYPSFYRGLAHMEES